MPTLTPQRIAQRSEQHQRPSAPARHRVGA